MAEQPSVRLGKPGNEPSTRATLEVAGGAFVLRPEKWVEQPQQVKVRCSSPGNLSWDIGDRPGVVADFKPRPLWGIDNGAPFTVLNAQMSVEEGWGLPQQVYEAQTILHGAHIDVEESPADAVRIAFSITSTGWADSEPVRLGEGHISPWVNSHGPGLIWEPTTPHTVHTLRQRFPPLLQVLLRLWTGEQIEIRALQVRLRDAGWCTLDSPKSTIKPSIHSLLRLTELDMGVVAKWLETVKELGPIPFLAMGGKAPLQSEAQLFATALEGLHRRLYPNRRRFQAPESQRRKTRRAAIEAAVKVLEGTVDETDVRRAYGEALGHVQEPSYLDRLQELLPRVESTAPGLMGPSLSAWTKEMKDVRNIQSHGLKRDDEFGEAEVAQYYVLASSGRWALKILLLLELVDQDTLRSALWNSDRFMYALANIDREHYWPDFSAYEQFSTAVQVTKEPKSGQGMVDG